MYISTVHVGTGAALISFAVMWKCDDDGTLSYPGQMVERYPTRAAVRDGTRSI